MAVTACPTAVVRAPAATVWELLARPEQYERWAGVRLVSVEPPGPARAGQRIDFRARGLGRWWPVVFTVGEVDPPRRLELTVALPLGVLNHEQVVLSPIEERLTRVTFN